VWPASCWRSDTSFTLGALGSEPKRTEIWDRDPKEDDTLGYLMEYVAILREAMPSVTSRGHGLLVVLN